MKRILLSNRARFTPTSPIRKLAKYANQAKEKGVKVYHFNIGQPDIASPSVFYNAMKEYTEPVIAYEDSRGNKILRRTWANYLNTNYNLDLTEDNFIISMGASEALLFIFMSCCDPGDEVIVPSYTYTASASPVYHVGAKIVMVDIEKDTYHIDYAKLNDLINEKTKAIIAVDIAGIIPFKGLNINNPTYLKELNSNALKPFSL